MTQESITKGQLNLLLSLWSLQVTSDDPEQDRAARLGWATRNLGRPISSFNELTKTEARTLIELAKIGEEIAG